MAIQILMPALSPTMTEGTLARWLKAEGDAVASGDLLAEIETDKATMELEAIDDGVLGKIIVPEGSEGIAVNAPIAVLLEEGEDASAMAALDTAPTAPPPTPPAAPEAAPKAAPAAPEATPTPAPAQPAGGARVFASPLARRLAGEAGLEITGIIGSGPHGRIVKADVEAAIAGGNAAPAPASAPAPSTPQLPATTPSASVPAEIPGAGPYTDIPHTNMRRVIAERLTESARDIPHFYLTVDCAIDALLAMRKDLNGRAPEGDGAYKISVNDFVIRAVALAMRKVPGVNVSWMADATRQYADIDVAVAVATPGGLITPILRRADQKGLAETSNEMKDLAARARDGKLSLDEFQGGGFTISNLGMFGIKEFSAIINPPQSCILAVGAGAQRPVVKDGALGIATVMSCTLSTDHRTVDGALGAEFMTAFKAMIEDPLTMLL
ncbi:MAG: pyruvate dehydrogenase complex dihydrolipoamide acetyltransferase [Rhodospirillaceae bacterium]|jgi:pyruvate dehydrogenase E2 component (dihydrolipoamide acetyltransferase)|nr:pyruvate dehydrogenase complex dihydrolipoamide acetyltransferase [Rhodospirillaceae bacterium]MBT4118671.1 pyruvate dehydrogenase complex dihydrolipoamide acetyltransferase [Rhodospirillaceae bacterium]MBT4672543.1 pyruvate dehydrogenase complex dihydrolipoamide acetyltransferase [Rhodospirillaceae bacterium]MBT4720721.1 pyruvate dehydrogenase complex dihydrolipoamide acetyltransferase [Rhodospirillaceae bacterium]MBT5180928.1 pyruvate dehydrogenase complex dihydrolipoamide acetyltransferas